MNTEQLAVPRLLYRGPDDKGALPPVIPPLPLGHVLSEAHEIDRLQREEAERVAARTETLRVESREELDRKLAEGWRLHRALDTAAAKDADAAADEASDPDAPAKAGKSAAKKPGWR